MLELISMTATFGKLEHETLRLRPGLNIVTAPNEWGKSTWCAFLTAMLYGLDTRQRAAKGMIPAKERYKPWSGRPMEGVLELRWNGRPVTIQRQTKGRVPLGVFRAFDPETGADIPGLTADTCGRMLLGVEESVYRRSGFIRLQDLPVTQDEATLRRLNALVSTGNDGTQAEFLAKALRDLRNRCQSNAKTGALPQLRQEQAALRQKAEALEELTARRGSLEKALAQAQEEAERLDKQAAYWAARADGEKLAQLAQAQARLAVARDQAEQAEARCRELPAREELTRRLALLHEKQEALGSLELERAMTPPAPVPPAAPGPLAGLSADRMEAKAAADQADLGAPPKKAAAWPLLLAGVLALAGAGALYFLLPSFWPAAAAGLLALGLLAAGLICRSRSKERMTRWLARRDALLKAYGAEKLTEIPELAQAAARAREAFDRANAETLALDRERADQGEALRRSIEEMTGGRAPAQYARALEQAMALWDQAADARRDAARWESQTAAMETMARGLAAPQTDLPAPEQDAQTTQFRLAQAKAQILRLRSQLDETRGRIAALPPREQLEDRIQAMDGRAEALTDYYQAAVCGLEALNQAQEELRRRFAPQLTALAASYMSRLTGGRYDRLLLEQDLSLSAGAAGEDVLRPVQYRSDGTVDQLYLALRLAMSRVLLPQGTPLILDDALVRFDAGRLALAMEVLGREAEDRQVVVFTCTGREEKQHA